MKKTIILAAIAGVLALSACSATPEVEADSPATTEAPATTVKATPTTAPPTTAAPTTAPPTTEAPTPDTRNDMVLDDQEFAAISSNDLVQSLSDDRYVKAMLDDRNTLFEMAEAACGSFKGGETRTEMSMRLLEADISYAKLLVPVYQAAEFMCWDDDSETEKSSPDIDYAAEAAPAPEAPEMTPSQEQAIRSAESYLDYTAFSAGGLVGQLEYEGFSTDDANFAVFMVDADWMRQAELSAESYLDYTSFSCSGLISQLEYEEFTPEQARHGAASTGIC